MKVLDDTITDEIKKAEISGNWTLCLCLLELKQFRLEKRFNGMIEGDEVTKRYFETKLKLK